MIAALAVWSKIGLDRESKVAFAPSVPTPTAGSLRPWDTRTPAFGRGFGCRPGGTAYTLLATVVQLMGEDKGSII
jgi:hypothetical protein